MAAGDNPFYWTIVFACMCFLFYTVGVDLIVYWLGLVQQKLDDRKAKKEFKEFLNQL